MTVIVKTKTIDLKLLEDQLKQAKQDIIDSKNSALGSVGFFASRSIKRFILADGQGAWKKPHPLTSGFKVKKKEFRRFSKKFKGPSGLLELAKKQLFTEVGESGFKKIAKFTKYFIDEELSKVTTGFSFDNKKPNPKLEKKVDLVVAGWKITVSDKMRGFFAAQGFPLMKTTNQLVVPKRSLNRVNREIGSKVFDVFIRKFKASLGRKNNEFLRFD